MEVQEHDIDKLYVSDNSGGFTQVRGYDQRVIGEIPKSTVQV